MNDRVLIARVRTVAVLGIAISLVACATVEVAPDDCPAGTQKLEGCPPIGAISDSDIGKLYAQRTWANSSELGINGVGLGEAALSGIHTARTRFIGSTDEGAITSLTAKLWMIRNAEHTIDAVYYIFRDDLVGQAILGALCNAVQRGVDIRIMIDSIGSSDLKRKNLKALESCALDAGFMRNANGDVTIYRARVQSVIFNAASKILVKHNRRSHDKLLMIDSHFPDRFVAITGGRNVSLDYYGILPDGSKNPHTYRDSEMIVRGCDCNVVNRYSIGEITDDYYSKLFAFKNNKPLSPTRLSGPEAAYKKERQIFSDSLAVLTALPEIREYLEMMPGFMSEGFYETQVRLLHELNNLTDKNVILNAVENEQLNPTSITSVLAGVIRNEHIEKLRIVSPYMFAARYKDNDGNEVYDEARRLLDWLERHPASSIELVTNSVLTSDNFFTQAIVDMDVAPRLLLSEELQEMWLTKASKSELNAELIESDAWIRMVGHPRLTVYQTGRLDDQVFGGDFEYPKLHAKYMITDDSGFVGTTNFDYRSRLFNNEMGFFFRSKDLAEAISENTDYLISLSYRWGSPEWLEMRRRLMEMKGTKASSTRNQRRIYDAIKKTGLYWWF